MQPHHPIERELDELWSSYQDRTSYPVTDRASLKGFRRQIRVQSEERAAVALQPWLAIFELSLDLLADLHLAFNNNLAGPPQDLRRQTPWALLGAAASFGTSLCHACVLGYDTPAKAQLRTYMEALLLCVAVLHDDSLATAYLATTDDTKAVDFWHKHASPRKLHERIIQIEQQVGFEPDTIKQLTEWRRREYEVLSQSSHLSIVAATLTCMTPSIDDPQTYHFGVLGGVTASSLRTLSYAATATWHSMRLAKDKLFSHDINSGAHVQIDSNDPIHRQILVRWEVLSEIVPRYLT